jgi:hypothetical protein
MRWLPVFPITVLRRSALPSFELRIENYKMTVGIPNNCNSPLGSPPLVEGVGGRWRRGIAIASNPNRVQNPVRVCAVIH